jgi:tRNA-2-methylthio-N6-dimethylallyladenosine synthase
MNEADSRRLAAALEWLGYAPAARAEEADVVVLNTCVVRQSAEDRAVGRLSGLRPLKQRRPDLVIGLMGCLVSREVGPLQERFPWVDVFMPPSQPEPLLDYLVGRGWVDEGRALEAAEAVRRYRLQDAAFLLPAQERERLVSAHVPVVLGCSHACTYCVIPYRRGAERSRPLDEVLAETTALAAQGVREVTFLGQIVDRYGLDWAAERRGRSLPAATERLPLVALLERAQEIAGLQRIRFLTSHPNWMTNDLLEAVATLPKVCEHFEVPVQAGDDEVLARMRRGYTADDYRRLVARIRERVPGASIATDVIVGFPGETAEQFQRTMDLLAELRLDKAHIARYSPRPQTVAARRFPDDVPPEEKERRRRLLDEQQAEIVAALNARLLGQTVEVLVEGKKKGRWWGRTRTDRLVFFEDEGDWLGRLASVRITWAGPWSLIGAVGQSPQHLSE